MEYVDHGRGQVTIDSECGGELAPGRTLPRLLPDLGDVVAGCKDEFIS